MRSVRVLLAGAATFGAAVLIAACGSDISTQPSAGNPSPTRLAPSPIGHFDRTLAPAQYYATVRFTIDPRNDAYIAIGPHYLYIPAGAVCDPNSSGYGVWAWDLPCSSTSRAITVTAKAYLLDKHPVVEFDTHLRFRPSRDGRYDVMLYMRDDNANAKSVINWCADSSSSCVDESKTSVGKKLNTRFDPKGFYVYREIEHFSGYNVTGGRDCDAAYGCEGGL